MTAHASPALGTAARRRARTGARLVALTLAAVAPPAVPAAAQIAPGTSGRSSTLVFNDAGEAWRTLVAFGNCYADRNTEQALALVAADPGSNEEAQTYRRMFSRDNQSCLGGSTELRMPLAMVRGAIVEGLYRRGIALPEALRQPPLAADAEVRTLSEAARCYTAAHRGEVERAWEGRQSFSRRRKPAARRA